MHPPFDFFDLPIKQQGNLVGSCRGKLVGRHITATLSFEPRRCGLQRDAAGVPVMVRLFPGRGRRGSSPAAAASYKRGRREAVSWWASGVHLHSDCCTAYPNTLWALSQKKLCTEVLIAGYVMCAGCNSCQAVTNELTYQLL